jgi:hypothetical protein
MAIIRRPPGLAVGHQRVKVPLYRLIIERLEFLRIVEILAEGIWGAESVLVEDVDGQLVGPPVAVGPAEQGPQRLRFF